VLGEKVVVFKECVLRHKQIIITLYVCLGLARKRDRFIITTTRPYKRVFFSQLRRRAEEVYYKVADFMSSRRTILLQGLSCANLATLVAKLRGLKVDFQQKIFATLSYEEEELLERYVW
jgi:hypothetical protein